MENSEKFFDSEEVKAGLGKHVHQSLEHLDRVTTTEEDLLILYKSKKEELENIIERTENDLLDMKNSNEELEKEILEVIKEIEEKALNN